MDTLVRKIRCAIVAGEFGLGQELLAQLPEALREIAIEDQPAAARRAAVELKVCHEMALIQRSHLTAEWLELQPATRYRRRAEGDSPGLSTRCWDA